MSSPQATLNELLYISNQMAEHLQGFIDEARRSGSSLEETQNLVDTFKPIYHKVCVVVEALR